MKRRLKVKISKISFPIQIIVVNFSISIFISQSTTTAWLVSGDSSIKILCKKMTTVSLYETIALTFETTKQRYNFQK